VYFVQYRDRELSVITFVRFRAPLHLLVVGYPLPVRPPGGRPSAAAAVCNLMVASSWCVPECIPAPRICFVPCAGAEFGTWAAACLPSHLILSALTCAHACDCERTVRTATWPGCLIISTPYLHVCDMCTGAAHHLPGCLSRSLTCVHACDVCTWAAACLPESLDPCLLSLVRMLVMCTGAATCLPEMSLDSMLLLVRTL
jgi:hypothetical protein